MLSVPHLIIIFVVALVVFGPEKLPELARNLGKVMSEFRRATGDLRSTFEDHLRDLEREADERRIGSAPRQSAPQLPGASAASAPANAVPAIAPSARTVADTPDFVGSDTREGRGPARDSSESNGAGGGTNAPEHTGLQDSLTPGKSTVVPGENGQPRLVENENKSEKVGDGHS
jgi:TatA/E family protein of Tat protein translocase